MKTTEPLPQITVHISGPMGVGKTSLAALMASTLMAQGHTVTTHERDEQYLPSPQQAQAFRDARQIRIVVEENRPHGLMAVGAETAVDSPRVPEGFFRLGDNVIKLSSVIRWGPFKGESLSGRNFTHYIELADTHNVLAVTADEMTTFEQAMAARYK